jgi:thiol-disulfide isomerase/thioredoxin
VPLATRSLRIALAGLCLLTAAGCSSGGTGGGVVSFAAGHRKAAPDLSGTTIKDGAQFSLAAERGHVVVVNYWASWCDPCREELPQLDQVATEFKGQVTFIGVDFHGDTRSLAKSFLLGHDVPYDSLFDGDSKSVLQFQRSKVSIAAPPLTMVIDKQGRIADVIDGVVLYSDLHRMVTAANAEPA